MSPRDACRATPRSRAAAHKIVRSFEPASCSTVGAALLTALLLAASGCSTTKRQTSSPSDSSSTAAPSTDNAPSTPTGTPAANNAPDVPKASVNISYSHPGDYLEAFTVYKYDGLAPLFSHKLDPKDTTTLVRFNGGIVIWQFEPTHHLLSDFPGLKSDYRVPRVLYGKVPDHFSQTVPDQGPPEPLESGNYYVFSVKRHSGSNSYEALRVLNDGTFEGYAARPRAGTSYELCCNLDSSFVHPELSESLPPLGDSF